MPRSSRFGSLLVLALAGWVNCSQSVKVTREAFITPSRATSRASLAATTTANPGLEWLAGHQNGDGSFGNTAASIARPVQSTAEVLRTWQAYGQQAAPGFSPAIAYLSGSPEQSAESLARKIVVNAEAGNVTPWVNTLLTYQHPDGGFGPQAGYESNALDSAFALEALAAASYQSGPNVSAAVAFLLSKQQGSGGWAIGSNDASVYVTTGAMRALWPYRSTYGGVAAALTQAQNFLLARRGADALWGEDFLSALALITLIPNVADLSAVEASVTALRARQGTNGSWVDDSYTTALALQALQAYEARKQGTSPTAGAVSGYVVKANSTEPVAGALISVVQSPGIGVLTNSDGYYFIPGLPAGSYSISASKAGYAAASVVATVQQGQVTVADRLVLDVLGVNGVVRGKIFDAVAKQPLGGVQVTLSGTASYSVLTASTGDFDFGPVAPGSYGLKFEKTGYNTLNGTAMVVAGQVLTTQLGLTPAGGYMDDTPGTVRGWVVDGKSGQPLAGAVFDLGGGLAGTTGADGEFSIGSVPRATYAGTVRATGYQSVSFNLVFSAGCTGDVGTVSLFPSDTAPPPTTLTVRGLVADGVSNAPVPSATVKLVETGATVTTGADGRFTFSGLTIKSVNLGLSAAGYAPASYVVQASGFGEIEVALALSPPPADGATTSTLEGAVTDRQSGSAVVGARVTIPGTSLSAMTGADGQYSLSSIQTLEFAVDVSAVGYAQQISPIRLNAHGRYTLNLALQPAAPNTFQVASIIAQQVESGANATALFTARVASLLAAPKTALVLGEVQDGSGTAVAKVTPYAEGTTTPAAEFSFAAGELKELTIPWSTAQFAPATYRLVVRVVEPGTISRANPLGQVFAENNTTLKIVPAAAIDGAMDINPPLTQAGLSTPVSLTALVRNGGNVPLAAGPYELKVRNLAKNTTLFTAQAPANALDVGTNVSLSFGTWVPNDAGNLEVTVKAMTAGVAGTITGQFYVGDKASGTFTVSPTVVQEGTRAVRARIAMQGVDTSQGGSTDPLYVLVKQALVRAAGYAGPSAVAWHQSNRCLGCHIQTQSVLGLSSSFDKATFDRKPAQYLYNAIATSQWENGALRISYPEYSKTQTALGLWSLEAWPDAQSIFRAKYRAAQLIQSWKVRNGDQTYWAPDHPSGWWTSSISHTALAVKGYANLLQDATKPGVSSVPSYALGTAQSLGPGTQPEDVVAGPDGAIYVVKTGGVINRLDPASGAVTTIASGLPTPTAGLAIAADGTLNVTRGGSLIQIKPDGTRMTLSIGSNLTDAIFGPDGWLYLADPTASCIRRVGPAGQVETYVSGGLLNYPFSLEFDATGDLLVADQEAYNIIKIAAVDRSVSVLANGLAYKPHRMARAPDNSLYVSTNGPYTFGGLLRIRPDGTAENVLQRNWIFGVVAAGDRIFATHKSNNTIQPLDVGTLDIDGLAELRAEIPRAARYFLASYKDNNSDNRVHALRLIGLAEARDVVEDGALVSQIDTAIAFEADLLRTRQRADGGWAPHVGYSSDPLVTAMVGIALEYTNPSPDDPKIRAAIQYVLNTQRVDGSWDNFSNGMGTRLASTSFVMIFLPKALERLGGIDIDLHLELPPSVQLSNPTLPPATVTPVQVGGTAYTWRLLGVTGVGRNVDFDLTLADLALGEQRPVARKAYLEFDNSFVSRKEQLPLQIPAVTAASQMVLGVQTDKASYQANETVQITSKVTNSGPTTSSGQVLLSIRPAGETTFLADLPPQPVTDLAPGAQVSLQATWNTGKALAGLYEVYGKLLDTQGRVVSAGVVSFRIDRPPVLATTSVTTDKPLYGAWDTVTITGRVRNAAPNAFLAPSFVELTVKTPFGTPLYSQTRALNQLTPGALVDLSFKLTLTDAAAGTYPVTLVLKDDFTRAVLSTSTASFQVQRRGIQSLTGTVTVVSREVYQGDPNACTETARNVSASAVTGVKLIHRLVNADSGAVLDAVNQTVDLAGGGTNTYLRSISTQGLAKGGYACILMAELDGATRTLASAGFRVVEPPVKFTASLALGMRGRLLVLLDGPLPRQVDGDDPHGPQGTPKLAAQRAFLETLLTNDGWSYTITQTADDFTREFHTGGYLAYALFSEQEKLSEQTQQELREAVFRGEGLLVAGDHDSRNQKVHDALGVKYIGHLPGMTGVTPVSGSALPGAFNLLAGEHPLRVQREGAATLGVYQGGGALDAVTLNAYGRAKGGFSGADLLAIATRDGQSSPAADDLRKLLRLVHAPAVEPRPGTVVPVVLTVTNQGIAVPVTVTGAAAFSFLLAENEVKKVTFFVRMPKAADPVTVKVEVTGTHGSQTFTVTPTLTVNVAALETLPQLQAKLEALAKALPADAKALRKASNAVERAIRDPSSGQAVKFVLQACDELRGSTDPRVVELRVGLDIWLRWTNLSANPISATGALR